MANTFSLPKLDYIAKLLTMLLGKEVSVSESTVGSKDLESAVAAGVYVDQQETPSALCVVDISLASYAGAALTMISAGVAKESIKSGTLAENLAENLYEVFNVCVAFFNQGDVPHIRFLDMYTTPPTLPPDVETLTTGDTGQLDVEVDIKGYGSGKMSLRAM